MRRLRPLFVSCVLGAGALLPSQAATTGDLAIVVNKTSALMGITSRDLRSVLLGEKENWPDGKKAIAALPPPERPDAAFLLKTICGMSEADYKRYFMQLSFQGKTATIPRILASPAAIKAFVASTPGAVGIIPATSVDSTVSMIPLDGGSPGAQGYKLAKE